MTGQSSVISMWIPGLPVGKGRARTAVATNRAGNVLRSSKTGRVVVRHYTPAKTRAYEELVAQVGALAMQGRAPLTCGVAFGVDVVLPIPKSWSKADKAAALAGTRLATAKPDLSNVVKAVEDGLNGVVWGDDSQIVRYLPSQKRYGLEPGVAVAVVLLGEGN